MVIHQGFYTHLWLRKSVNTAVLGPRVLLQLLKSSEVIRAKRGLPDPLQNQDVSRAALTAVKSDVLIAGVRVKPADTLFVAEEI